MSKYQKSFVKIFNITCICVQNIFFMICLISLISIIVPIYRVKFEPLEYVHQIIPCIKYSNFIFEIKYTRRVSYNFDNDGFFSKFIIPYIWPIAIACIYYIVFNIARLFIWILKKINPLKGFYSKVIFSRISNTVVLLILLYFTFSLNVDIANIFQGTSFEQRTRDIFTGTFASALFLLEGLQMHRFNYLCKLKRWLTAYKDENQYPSLCKSSQNND